jgi:hypothetical protein
MCKLRKRRGITEFLVIELIGDVSMAVCGNDGSLVLVM